PAARPWRPTVSRPTIRRDATRGVITRTTAGVKPQFCGFTAVGPFAYGPTPAPAQGDPMSFEKRIIVWVQRFKGRTNLMLQWHDPLTGERKSKSAETSIVAVAEMKRCELEYELNHNLHQETSRMSWEKFRTLFEDEYTSALRLNTREVYSATFNQFEELM